MAKYLPFARLDISLDEAFVERFGSAAIPNSKPAPKADKSKAPKADKSKAEKAEKAEKPEAEKSKADKSKAEPKAEQQTFVQKVSSLAQQIVEKGGGDKLKPFCDGIEIDGKPLKQLSKAPESHQDQVVEGLEELLGAL